VHLKAHHRLVALLVAVPGVLICLGAVALFLEQVVNNRVLGPIRGNERQYYLAVGDAYSGGFITGFFLCFFLVIMGIVATAYFESRRAAVRAVR